MSTNSRKIVVNNRNSFFIIKNYLDMSFKKGIFNQQDLLLINASLEHIAKKLRVTGKPPLKTIKEGKDDN